MVVAASHANGKSPIRNVFQTYFSGLEALGQAYDPFMKGLARTQLEVLGFANRRAQAYMQIPARAAQCRTPQDVFSAQMQFWQTAMSDYQESVGRVTNALASCALPNLAAITDEAIANAHDYISFPEVKETQPQTPVRNNRERKAA
jgi:hypothetical protein